jgi:hypothetical protein
MCHIFALSKIMKVSNINFACYSSAKGHNVSSLPTTIMLEAIARVSKPTLSLLTYIFTMIPNTWWISVCSPNAHIHATMTIEYTIIMCTRTIPSFRREIISYGQLQTTKQLSVLGPFISMRNLHI